MKIPDTKYEFNTWIKLCVLFFFIGVVFFRSPILFIEPRLWAEESSVFLKHSLHSNWFDGIIFSPKYTAGYLLLACSLPTTIAALLPLELAPYITTYFSFLFLVILLAKIIWTNEDFLKKDINKIISCSIILFFPSAESTGETWLNTTNLQVYCACISLMILLSSSKQNKRTITGNLLLLMFCCLSGPYTLFLAPAFIYRFFMDKSRVSTGYAIVLGLCGLIQITTYLYLKYSHLLSTKKETNISVAKSIIGIFKYHIVQPILGMNLGQKFLHSIGYSYSNSTNILHDYLVVASILSFLLIAIILFFSWKNNYYHRLLMISFVFVAFFTAFFSIGNQPGGRYALFPSVILGFILLSCVNGYQPLRTAQRIICSLFLMSGIIIGVTEFWSFKSDRYLGTSESIPDWSRQIKKWRQNDHMILTAWPFPQWKFKLSHPTTTDRMRELLSQIEPFTIKSVPNQWAGKIVKLEGGVHDFAISLKMKFVNLNSADALQVRLLSSANPENFFWATINTQNSNNVIIDRRVLNKEGFPSLYKIDQLEIRLKSINIGATINVKSIKYLSPLASF